ncbi:MAG: GNAT family N-acetyltransferase [Ilumatobacteraceae bacterium]
MIVTLRQPQANDIDWITKACQDNEIQRWTTVPRPYLRRHAEEYVLQSHTQPSIFAVIELATDLGVGMINIHGVDQATGEAVAGYWIAPWARRRGVATQALQQLIEHARTLPGATTLTLKISPANVASRGTAAKSGFVVVRTETQTCHDGDTATDALIYSLPL